MDTKGGYVRNKIHLMCLPVIVMEYMGGGEMFDRIQERKSITEKYISRVLKDVMKGLEGLHSCGYLHRDIKLENLMLVDTSNQSHVKIIDFGMMVEMDTALQRFQSKGVQGTRGYVAPESITRSEYSPKTDVFQTGCTLYALLSGFQAFNPNRLDQLINGKYFKMQGSGWDNISAEAKALVEGMLKKDPAERLSVQEVLQSPWLRYGASEMDMGEAYYDRIKNLVLRQKVKDFFLDCHISEGNKVRRARLKELVPYLTHSTVFDSNSSTPTMRTAELSPTASAEFDDKIARLREVVIRSCSMRSQRAYSGDNLQIPCRGDSGRITDLSRQLKYEDFVRILNECGLPELANRKVFRIFDIGKNGQIDLKEFLVTMVAFRGEDDETKDQSDDDSEVWFYFNMFDINNTGHIDLEELKLAVECILLDDCSPRFMVRNFGDDKDIETLFKAMDIGHDGLVDYGEFKAFYDTIIIQSSPRLEEGS